MLNVRNSTTKIRATEFPSFLYPSDTNYNPEKPLAGLFRGPLLIWASTMTYIYHRLTVTFSLDVPLHFQGGKLHCTGPDVLPNRYNVAVEDGSVDRYRITRVRARVSTGFLA